MLSILSLPQELVLKILTTYDERSSPPTLLLTCNELYKHINLYYKAIGYDDIDDRIRIQFIWKYSNPDNIELLSDTFNDFAYNRTFCICDMYVNDIYYLLKHCYEKSYISTNNAKFALTLVLSDFSTNEYTGHDINFIAKYLKIFRKLFLLEGGSKWIQIKNAQNLSYEQIRKDSFRIIRIVNEFYKIIDLEQICGVLDAYAEPRGFGLGCGCEPPLRPSDVCCFQMSVYNYTNLTE